MRQTHWIVDQHWIIFVFVHKINDEISKNIQEIKKYASVPTLAGFGIKSTEDARLLAKCSDGVIIGSSLVKMIEENSGSREFDRIGQYITEIKQAIS